MTEHIVAVFHDASEAAAAESELQQMGLPAGAVRRYTGNGDTITPARSDAPRTTGQTSGFWAWLLGEESSSTAQQTDYRSDADRYDQRSSAGDTVLSVTLTDDTQIHRTIEVLEAHHPVGIDETTDDYEGAASTDAFASRGSAASTDTYASPGLSTSAAASPSTTSAGEARTAVQGGEEEVIPLAKEEVDIGKRQVDRGTTRVRRYVVETPVEREVNLQGERVTVERRRPAAGAASGAGQFEERVVELHETEEVPVVQKTARVDEEVVVRREPTERTETVRDTVRREQVEVTPDQPEHKRSE